MGRLNVIKQAFNRGRISKKALARTDLERVALASEVQTNWMSNLLGSMGLRTGLGYITSTYNNAKAVYLNFIFSLSDQAEIELTNNNMRVIINDVVVTRPTVTSTIANGTFDSNLTSWTDADEVGATSAWGTGGYMGLMGDGTAAAIRRQTVTVAGANINVEHGVRIVVNRGIAKFRIGSTSGGEEYVTEATLGVGTYSFALTPTGDFYIQVSSITKYQTLIDSITIESAGAMVLPTGWAEADLKYIRYDQSADIVYLACKDVKQYKIERRATRSWGIAEYLPEDGPFFPENTTATTVNVSALSGNITIAASNPVFKSSDVGSLYKITSIGQTVSANIATDNTFTDPIRVTGVDSSRVFTINITGTWVATIRLQRSIGEVGSWENVGAYTANTTVTFDDGLDNQIVFYRLGIESAAYTSGTAGCSLIYSLGQITGVVRITQFTSSTAASAIVLKDLGGTSLTSMWSRGVWSSRFGYPSSVAFYEGRLWWAGKDKIISSVSDGFESFDEDIEGDSAAINRSIGSGPIDSINWLLGLQRLVIGAETSEKVVRSNSLDDIVSPTVFNIKTPSTKGSTPVRPLKLDTSGLFVRNNRLFEMQYDGGSFDYVTVDLTSAVPEIGGSGFSRIAVQRYPDTRIHCVKNDGTAACLIFDRNEDLKCWIDIETDGVIEDVIVKLGVVDTVEDDVYYTIKRNINGSDVRYHEKFAMESECVGGTQNKQADSFIAGTQSSSATIAGLSHLNGEAVVVWADGKCYSPRVNGVQTTFTVSGGSITLPAAVTSYVVGLPYKARYKSTKLAYGAQGGTALLQMKKVETLGIIMADTHNRGLRYGRDFDSLFEMPQVEQGKVVDADYVWTEYDEQPFEFDGEWDTDSRVCLEAMAPMPCTLLAMIMTMKTNEKV